VGCWWSAIGRTIVAWYAVPGVLWAGALAADARQPARFAPSGGARPIDWRRLCGNGQMQLLCTQQLLRAAAMVFFMSWFPRFLQVTRERAGPGVRPAHQLVALGALLGSASGGFVSDGLVTADGGNGG